MVDLALAIGFGEIVGDGPDDPAAGVLGDELGDHVAQLGPLLARIDFAGDPHLGGEGHVDEEPAGEGNLRRDARPLRADRLLDDLDELGLPALQLIGDIGSSATAGTAGAAAVDGLAGSVPLPGAVPIAVPIAFVVFVLTAVRFGGVLVLVRLDQVGRVGEGA